MKWKVPALGIVAILLFSGIVVATTTQVRNCCNTGEQTQNQQLLTENRLMQQSQICSNVGETTQNTILRATTTLSDLEIDGLQYMREEEKLARDVYLTLYEKWNTINIFYNIAQSEQRHMDSIKQLLDKYSIDDPTQGNDIGVFTNLELQTLYNQLISEGDQSLIDALTVGGKIEELDIIDLTTYISLTDKADIQQVYHNLLKGSENHLRAFVKALKNQGITYEPFYLSQQEFDDIINQGTVSLSQRVNKKQNNNPAI